MPRKRKSLFPDEIGKRHVLLSSVYGYLLWNGEKEGLRIVSVSALLNGVPVITVLRTSDSKNLIQIVPTLKSDPDNFLQLCRERTVAIQGITPEIAVATNADSPFSGRVGMDTPKLRINQKVLVAHWVEDGIQEHDAVDRSNLPNITPCYPHPYYYGIDFTVLLDFLNNSRISGAGNTISRIVSDASELAFRLSVGYDLLHIRIEMNNLVRILGKIGALDTSRGRISSDLSSMTFKRNFHSRYTRYLERIGKKTIFDFESLI